MKKKLIISHGNFIKHFHYGPKFPADIDFDQDAFAEELDECVKDNFDYTIEKYGTRPPTRDDKTELIID